MRTPLFRRTASALVVALVAGAPTVVEAQVGDAPASVAEIPHQSGGVGREERELLQREASQYNLKLIFARVGDAAFVSGAQVEIRRDDRILLTATSSGPWFYARLEPGTYQVAATLDGVRREDTITIAPGSRAQTAFRWESADTD